MVALETPVDDEPLAQLRAAVEQLAGESLDHAAEAALEGQLIDIRRQIDRLEAEFSRRLRRFEQVRGFVSSGAAAAVAWLRDKCRLSSSAAHQRVEVARELEKFPEIEDAWRRSNIGYEHAATLARSAREVGHETVRAMLADLLDAARRLDPSRLRCVTRHLRYCVDPGGATSAEEETHRRRFLTLSQTLDGALLLDGQLDAEGGALLRTAISALNKPVPNDTRSAPQRRADALVELASRQLQSGALPTTHGQRPHVVVTVPATTVAGRATEPGDLAGAGPVSRELVRRLACDAAITEITVDGSGSPVAVAEASRTIPAPLRTVLAMRDRGCRFPGCDRPPEWTDAHHLRPRQQDGPNRAENLVLLCRLHHRAVHEGGWRLHVTADGALQALPP
jgi:hypothetical protein